MRAAARLSCLVASSVALASALLASPSRADVPVTDWRQSARPMASNRTPQRFFVELRFGAYRPDVDAEFGGDGPYKRVFGDSSQFYLGTEFDWQALRIPYFGTLGPGLGWGYTKRSVAAKITGTSTDSAENTALMIMPWHVSAVARADELMRRTGVPFVPYAKLGLGMAMWSASNAEGVSTYPRDPDPLAVRGRGITWGQHFALGAMLALNELDRKAAATLDGAWGVNHAYVFGEWMNAKLDGMGSTPQMHVGSSSWVLGLAFDM